MALSLVSPDDRSLMAPFSCVPSREGGGGRPLLLVKDGVVHYIAFSNRYPDDRAH